ncbi:MAG: NAD-dependent protein deacetylase [Aquabacterium sp.]
MSLSMHPDPAVTRLAALMQQGPFAVITGAGLSTGSGIPAYRDDEGQWQHPQPVQQQDFMRSDAVRRRYWARSYIGWQTMGRAAPNAGHVALARLAQAGHLGQLITQNVDGLHQKAGSLDVIELHGGIAQVRCMACGLQHARAHMQLWLAQRNAALDVDAWQASRRAPDGDAHLDDESVYARFEVPECPSCGGLLKPDVVFFGDNVPRDRVAQSSEAIARSAGLLIVGSSLMVYSGFRFADLAHRLGKPVVALNRGRTRADPLLTDKIETDCGQSLLQLMQALAA